MKIENFINRLEVNRQYASSTVTSYRRTLNIFNEYVKELYFWKKTIEDTELLSVRDVETFISLQKIRWKSARTCNWYLACIRDFVFYAERNGEKVFNYKEILLMKEQRRKIEALSENEVQRLLKFMKTDETKDELTKIRDYAMVSVLLYTWLRVSELCNIRVEDVKEELQIIGKNSTLRLVYLFQEHLTLIRLYLFMREWKKIKSDYLFCSHSNNALWKKLTRVAIEWIVRTAGLKAWITDPIWPHKLRHTFATSLLRRWGNIYYIKELLWHQHITTTQTYLSATNKDLKKTQNLLQSARLAEQMMEDEELDPMPENILIKDPNVLNQLKNRISGLQANFQNPYGRGVPNYRAV